MDPVSWLGTKALGVQMERRYEGFLGGFEEAVGSCSIRTIFFLSNLKKQSHARNDPLSIRRGVLLTYVIGAALGFVSCRIRTLQLQLKLALIV